MCVFSRRPTALGPLRALVNNASTAGGAGAVVDIDVEMLREVLAVNVVSASCVLGDRGAGDAFFE
jgi:NAD(P)-dependent dehydrogenase (short-subunit alcohol dehydrogenase family)